MQAIAIIGFDIAKSVFQVHGVDAAGNVVVRRQLKRRCVLTFFQKLPPCLVGIEACVSCPWRIRKLRCDWHLEQTAAMVPPSVVVKDGMGGRRFARSFSRSAAIE